MANEDSRPTLTLIKGKSFSVADVALEPIQATLFPMPKKTLVVFVFFPTVTEEEFTAALESTSPTFVIELRPSPRFDIGRLNRREAFQRFEVIKATYVDLLSDVERSLGAGLLLELRSRLTKFRNGLTGPLMFLIDSTAHELTREITQTLGDISAQEWDVCEVPSHI
jgi:hypothetical protein